MRGGRRTDLEIKAKNGRNLTLSFKYLGTLLEMVLEIRQANWKCLLLVRDSKPS